MAVNTLRTPPYYGGKGNQGAKIAACLPWSMESVYVEPFAGMARVLLNRLPVQVEIINDLDGNLARWWRVIRDMPDEFTHVVDFTPRSRELFEQAIIDVNDETLDDLRRAGAYHCLIESSVHSGASTGKGNFRTWWAPSRFRDRLVGGHILDLWQRLRYVIVENRPALDILERIKDEPSAVIYADPPYISADTSPYAVNEVDVDALGAAFQAQAGFVAVSGYGNEWDFLGWERAEFDAVRHNIHKGGRKFPVEPRVEVLWTNKPVVNKQELLI